MTLLEAVGSGMSYVIRWTRYAFNVLFHDAGRLNVLLPLFAVGIAISAILLGIKIVRSFTWGS